MASRRPAVSIRSRSRAPERAGARRYPLTGIYLNPIRLLHGAEGRRALLDGLALPLAGSGIVFAGIEAIRRDRSGRTATIHPVRDGAVAGLPAEAGPGLARLQAPRAPFAGLAADRLRLMGILNVTPDSFSDGGRYLDRDAAIGQAEEMIAAGAEMIDVGGESTRPGARPVDIDTELDRVLPAIERLAGGAVPVSIDTRNAEVMRRAIAAGASVVNDVSALSHDAESLDVVAVSNAAVILMHAQGDPRTMQQDPRYEDVLLDVYDTLAARVADCRACGIAPERIAIDPGIGFGKTPAHNAALLDGLAMLHGIGCVLLLGASRKSFIARLDRDCAPEQRVGGSVAAALCGAARGVQWLRVHDVGETRQALAVWRGIGAA